ncbi:MAG: type II toxin-antitoxin system VapC family toxin [Gammaproteobacteria bacterium]|nr:type II toxin-antitoxin system VapC family toxin [Gammaproteobacteria bacterium]
MNYFLDSNMLIYYLNKALSPAAKKAMEQAIADGATVSVITRLEILGWYDCTEEKFKRGQILLEQFDEIPLNESIVQRCIGIRRAYRIKLPDAIIAATALDSGLPLMTRNIDDFRKISGLKAVNPF